MEQDKGASSQSEDRATQATPQAPSGLGHTVSVPSADYAGTDFARGAQACREMMARFVEQGGDTNTAASIRANWHPGWGDDPGPPPDVLDTWEAPECPEGEALYAEYVKSVIGDEDHAPDTSQQGLLATAAMLERWAVPMFPANRIGQIPIVRGMIECAIRDLRALAQAMSAGTAETQSGSGPKDRQRGPKDAPKGDRP
jgi:hypothetical protein